MHIAQTSKGSNGSVEIRPATLELARREPLPNPAEVFEDGMRLHHMANTAYPIAHHKTIWRFRADPEFHEELMRRAVRGVITIAFPSKNVGITA